MQNRKIKLIWDFRGPDAHATAERHTIHLREFALREKLAFDTAGTEQLDDHHSIAWLHAEEAQMRMIRDALRPQRAVLAED